MCSTSYYEYDRRIQRIAKVLIEEGYVVNWISRVYDQKSTKNKSEIQHVFIDTFFKSGPFFYLEYNFKIYKLLRSLNTDLVYSVDLDTLLACAKYAQKNGTKLLFDAHELYYEVPELESKRFKKSIWKRLSKSFIPKVQAAITVNSSLKDYFEKKYNTFFSVVRNVPISKHPEIKSNNLNNKTIAYLGAVNKGRGVELMLEALQELKDYRFELIGDGDLTDEMKALAQKLKVDDRTTFHGYLNPEDISEVLTKCSIGINALDPISDNYVYSLANKFFDYMHHHLPSINMRFPEYEKILSEHQVGIMMSDYSMQSLVIAIREYEDSNKYSLHIEHCKKAKTYFTWEKEKHVLLDLIAKTIS